MKGVSFLRAEWKTFVGLLLLLGVVGLILRTEERQPPPVVEVPINVRPGEGLGGVRLGMSAAEVGAALGEPSSTHELKGGLRGERHEARGLEVIFEGDRVIAVRGRVDGGEQIRRGLEEAVIASAREAAGGEGLEDDAALEAGLEALIAEGGVMALGEATFGTPALAGPVVADRLRALDQALGRPLKQHALVPGVSWQRYDGGLIAVTVKVGVQERRLYELMVIEATPGVDGQRSK